MKFGFIIPVYNHGKTLEGVVQSLLQFNFPVIVVDDGNDDLNKGFIRDVSQKYSLVSLVTRKKNGGKGRAMRDGVLKANEMGLTHIIQIDSDGQHDASRVGQFIELSIKNPKALICGYPDYDESVPESRKNGRKVANLWIKIVTLSASVKDALIGFRVYPVAPYVALLRRHAVIDSHMGYDCDILVHLIWAGVPVINESVKITYPKDGISNYRKFLDTVHISLAYARLCLGMFLRFPVLITRKIRNNKAK